MAETHAPTFRVAILAFPEVTASVLYGLYDILLSAGRDWGMIVDGSPGASPMQPVVVSRFREPFEISNGVQVRPEQTLDECTAPDIIFVPEVAIPPGAPIAGFDAEVAWLRRCHAAGATIATSCSGAMLLAQTGLLDDHDATTHWAYCDVMRTRHPAHTRALTACARRQRRGPASGDGRRRHDVAGPRALPDLAPAGLEVAMQTARINLIDWHEIGQQPFARLARSRQWRTPRSHAARRGSRSTTPSRHPWLRWCGSRACPSARSSGAFSRRPACRRSSTSTRCDSKKRSNARNGRRAGRGDRQRSRLRGRRLLQPPVSATGALTPAQYRRRFGAMRRALQSAGGAPLH